MTEHPRASGGRAFSGVCPLCGEPIYSMADHEGCIYDE